MIAAFGAAGQRSLPLELAAQPMEHLAKFGTATAISGDTLVVSALAQDNGATLNTGAAMIYRWSGSGWTPEATIFADDGAPDDMFGKSVAIFGNLVAVGAPSADIAGDESRGAVYVFSRSGTTWTQVAKLTADDGDEWDELGHAVTIFGNIVVAGAPFARDGNGFRRGAAYAFASTQGVWSQRQKFTDAMGSEESYFGWSVSIYDYVIAIGAPNDAVNGNPGRGSVSIFVRSDPEPMWTLESRVVQFLGAQGDQFGHSVAASTSTVIVGSPGFGSVEQGAVFPYQRSGNSWIQQTGVTQPENYFTRMGDSLAYHAGILAVGSPYRTVGGLASAGAVDIYRYNGSWTRGPRFELPAPGLQDFLGTAVAIAGDRVVVGAPGHSGVAPLAGSAWVFSQVGSKWMNHDAGIVADDGANSDLFGSAADISGDTAVIGASQDDGTFANQGSVYVKVRSGSGWAQEQKLVAPDPAVNDYFGNAVSIDGSTLIVGAPLDDIGANVDQGSAYVYVKSGSVWTLQQKLTAADGAGDDYFGWSVCVRGNIAMIGSLRDDQSVSLTNTGSLYIFTRSGTVWTQTQKIVPGDLESGDQFGGSVAFDGANAIVGAPNANPGGLNNRGAAYTYGLSAGTWTFQQKLTAAGGLAQDNFGKSVAISIQSAAFRIIIGAPGRDVGPNVDQGTAYIFARTGSWTLEDTLVASDGAAGDIFGEKVALSGRIAAVSAIFDDVGPDSNRGSAYLFTSATDRWLQAQQVLVPGTEASSFAGVSLALRSDTLLVGASGDTVGVNGAQGSVFSMDVPAGDFPVASNLTLGANVFPTLAGAMATLSTEHVIAASEAAFRSSDPVDVLLPSIALVSWNNLHTPWNATLRFDDGAASPGSYSYLGGGSIGLFGPVIIAPENTLVISSDRMVLGAGPALSVSEDASLETPDDSWIDIHIFRPMSVEELGGFFYYGEAHGTEPMELREGSVLGHYGIYNNFSSLSADSSYLNLGLLWNRNSAQFSGSSTVWGNYYNETNAITTLDCGTLAVARFTSGGIVRFQSLQDPCPQPPVLSVYGDLTLLEASEMTLPATGSRIETGGWFSNRINSNSRFDLAQGELRMGGFSDTSDRRVLEAASTDIGPSSAGLNRDLSGHFPIGTLTFYREGTEYFELSDGYDNDGNGLGEPYEAIYVDTLNIGSGVLLFTYDIKIYYRTLINDGWVDEPANLIPYCVSDIDGQPGTDLGDFFLFLNCFDASEPCADIDGSPGVDLGDFFAFLSGFDVGC